MTASRWTGLLLTVAFVGCAKPSASDASHGSQDAGVTEPALEATPPTIAADALKASAKDDAVRAFYERTGWNGLWSKAGAAALDQAVASRADNGLDHVAFGQSDDSMSPAERDVARTKTALAYAAALAHGITDPTNLHDIYTVPRAEADVAAGLAEAVRQNRVAHYFAGLAPQDDEYRKLAKAYVSYARHGDQQKPDKVATDETIHAGDRDARVGEIARQLAANGYVAADAVPATDGDRAAPYTAALVQGVKRLQADYGIKSDGVIGSDTLEVINIGPGDKARALAVALERRRWLSRTPPATRIDVNTAAAALDYIRDGKLVDRRRVIVGQPGRETPALRAPLYRLVANPTWTVPKSIDVSAATVRAKDMHRVNGYWVQPSGRKNALGVVKFDLKDDQQIYLHDTSDRSLFDRTQRSLSHGCVRVQDAPGFAAMIAQAEGVAAEWKQARKSGDQTFVALPHPIPVRLLYHNVFVDTDGQVVFRTDPYGWNGAVAAKLGFGGGARKANAKDIDLGP